MKPIYLLGIALLSASLAAQSAPDRADYGPVVERVLVDGRPRLTVIAEDYPAKEILRRIAQSYDLEVVGLAHLDRTLINAHIEGRELQSTLTAILGSVDMQFRRQAGVLEIMPIPEHDSVELFALAEIAWADFYRRFPAHPMAPHAQFSRAEIKEQAGRLSAARDLYLKLAKDYPESLEMGPALLRAGQLSGKQGDTAQASQIFRRLSTLDIPHALQTNARIELARVLVDQGDPQQALNLLKSMEVDYPAMDQGEATVRRLIRARALNQLGKFVNAMREIDMLDSNFDDLSAREALYIRATAFDGMGLHADASRAWLLFATDTIGKERSDAFASAARLALLANDELAVIFIAETAAAADADQGIEDYLMEAKERLGLIEKSSNTDLSSMLDEAVAWIESGEALRAMTALKPIFESRSTLSDAPLKARLAVTWARAIEAQFGLEQAIDVLRAERPIFSNPAQLGLLDIAAASLFEKHNQFVEATRAYQGEYGQ